MSSNIFSVAGFKKVITLVSNFAPINRYRSISKILKRLRALAYAGDSFECPFCKGRFSEFIPYGNPDSKYRGKDMVSPVYRMNALCPACDSVERERLFILYLERKTDIQNRPMSMLHIAPEKNLEKYLSSQSQLDYISMDISDGAMLKTDLCRLGIKDCAFDAIICSHVLEHIPNDTIAIGELFRVLKKGCWAIIQVPLSLSLEKTIEGTENDTPEKREELFGQRNHVRLYGQDYFKRLEKAGFSVHIIPPENIVEKTMVERYALNPKEDLFLCSKP